jgi:hypothetical protein
MLTDADVWGSRAQYAGAYIVSRVGGGTAAAA